MTRWILLLLATIGIEAGAAPPAVPGALDPWRDWAVYGQAHRDCPFVANAGHGTPDLHFCAWPGPLKLETTADGAVFSQEWRLYTEGWIALPGSDESFPVEVRVGNAAPPVVLRNGRPQVFLPAGDYRLGGVFRWARRPASIDIAPQTGLVELRADGATVAFPRLANGRLWLGSDERAVTTAAETLRLTVHRLATDGVPITIETRLRLEVSGPAREVTLGQVIPGGFVAMRLDSPLPARVEANGRLRIQVRPGTWQLVATARAAAVVDTLQASPQDTDWPGEEIWSWNGVDRLRVTSISGGEPVDPTRADVPGEWHNLPAYRLAAGQSLVIEQRSRGQSDSLQNQLSLDRSLWLDFDGGGMTAVDSIQGTMQTGWRLDIVGPWHLGSATLNGDNLLVTRGPDEDHTGVEIRPVSVSLNAVARVPATSAALPVTGWAQDFGSVSAMLYLPPAHRLIAAPGVDDASGDWIGNWRLLDYFLVLLIAVAVARLLGAATGVAALLLLILAWHEPASPTWIWLFVAAAVALARHAPEGRLKGVARGMRVGALALLVIIAVPFAAAQLRLAVYPQLESSPGFVGTWLTRDTMSAPDMIQTGIGPQPTDIGIRREARAKSMIEEAVVVSGSRMVAQDLARYAPGALVQTGPGIPSWQRNAVRLSWAGPVTATQKMRLIVLKPALLRLLRVMLVGLLGFVLWRLFRDAYGPLRLPARHAAPLALAIFAVATAGTIPDTALAQATPDPVLLEQLRQRLLQPPDCVPACAAVASAKFEVTAQSMTITLDVSSLETVAVALPGRGSDWLPRRIDVDGRAERLLYRDAAGWLRVVLPKGRHTVTLEGVMPQADTLGLAFEQSPHNVALTVSGWEISGVVDGRLVSGVLELVRIRSGDTATDAEVLEPGRLPPFVQVVRTLRFDVDWWIQTDVIRLAPEQGAFTVAVPLLPDERPLDESLAVADGVAQVGLSAGQNQRTWLSSLARHSPISLAAPTTLDIALVWRLLPGPVWHLEHDGVPVAAGSAQQDGWTPEFYPLPGETLTLHLRQPAAVGGETLVFDSVSMETAQGKRGSDTTLSLAYRSTRGGNHEIGLPAGVKVVAVTTDDMPQSVRPRDDRLTLPVLPGSHRIGISWTADQPVTARISTAPVDLFAEASNLSLQLSLPRDRWVLYTGGPQLGPAVLVWSELVAFALLAMLLGRIGRTPLRTHHWLLLGLGFSTFSWGVLFTLGVWLFACAWRAQRPMPATPVRYNLIQVGLAALTVVTMAALLVAVPQALLGYPEMNVAGNGSYGTVLQWFTDRTAGPLPTGYAVTVPLWIYKAAILLWSLWLAFALLRWLPWAWRAWSAGGIWRGRVVVDNKGAVSPGNTNAEP